MRTVDYTEFQENQEVDLADDEEDSLQSNDMRSTSSCSGNSIPTHSQTKSASKGEKKNQKGMKEVQSLILLWLRFEVLFNAKHLLYYSKDGKGQALNKIEEDLISNGFCTKDIAEKIADLRNCYGAQRRIVEACKKTVLVQTRFMKVNGSFSIN